MLFSFEWFEDTVDFRHEDFSYLVRVSQAEEEQVGVDAVLFQGTQMVVHDLFMAAQSRGGSPAGAHCHEVFGNVSGADAVNEYQAEQVLKVGGHLVGQVEGTVFLIGRFAAIERRMCRHEAEAHPAAMERAGGVVSYALIRFGTVHVMHVGIHGIDIRGGHGLGHAFQHVVGSVEVIRVEDSHHVARGHADALVHCVVNALVWLADMAQAAAVTRFVFLHYFESPVF